MKKKLVLFVLFLLPSNVFATNFLYAQSTALPVFLDKNFFIDLFDRNKKVSLGVAGSFFVSLVIGAIYYFYASGYAYKALVKAIVDKVKATDFATISDDDMKCLEEQINCIKKYADQSFNESIKKHFEENYTLCQQHYNASGYAYKAPVKVIVDKVQATDFATISDADIESLKEQINCIKNMQINHSVNLLRNNLKKIIYLVKTIIMHQVMLIKHLSK